MRNHFRRLRIFIGFLIAPALPILTVFFFQSKNEKHWELLWTAKIILTLAYASAVLFGIPVYIYLKKKNKFNIHSASLSGALIGLCVYILLFGATALFGFFSSGPEHSILVLKNSLGYSLLGVLYGLAAGISFWLIASKPKGNNVN